MRVCPKCGYRENPMWKPLAWRLYWEYAPLEGFKEGYPELASLTENLLTKHKCKVGNFYFHFEDKFYYYQITTKRATRNLVRRFPKGYESMANRNLFEKTPSEKGRDDIFQKKLLEAS